MGGGGRFPYPKWVWNTTGGWWPQPERWRINTAVALIWATVLSIPIIKYSIENERVTQEPHGWVPSMLWSKDFKRVWDKMQKETKNENSNTSDVDNEGNAQVTQ